MDLEAIRRLFGASEALHGRLWASIEHLTEAQFVQDVPYGLGSVRNHMVHVASVDQRWLARVAGRPQPERLRGEAYPTRAAARAVWDRAQARVGEALAGLREEHLGRPLSWEAERGEPPRTITVTRATWQVLLHVLNHGTDHRAQVLRLLHDLGAPTFEQDWILYWWEEPGGSA